MLSINQKIAIIHCVQVQWCGDLGILFNSVGGKVVDFSHIRATECKPIFPTNKMEKGGKRGSGGGWGEACCW